MLKEYNVSPFLEIAKLPSFLCLSFDTFSSIHSLNKRPFKVIYLLVVMSDSSLWTEFGVIVFGLGLIVLIKRGPLDPW